MSSCYCLQGSRDISIFQECVQIRFACYLGKKHCALERNLLKSLKMIGMCSIPERFLLYTRQSTFKMAIGMLLIEFMGYYSRILQIFPLSLDLSQCSFNLFPSGHCSSAIGHQVTCRTQVQLQTTRGTSCMYSTQVDHQSNNNTYYPQRCQQVISV
jgi:hypothetical protein